MIKRRNHSLFALILLAAAISAMHAASAADWPARPVTMVYPFAAGNAGDVLGRLFASRLSELLGQPVIFENVGGAGGMKGASRVARAAPDGYQFLLGGTFVVVNQTLYKNPPHEAPTDLVPVALLAREPIVLIARKDLPASNLQEFIGYATANQGKLQYGSAGIGSTVHMACALLNLAIGVSITHVPYRGGAGALQDLIAGRIDYQCPIATVAIPQIKGNSVKALAILSKDRSRLLPTVASAHEQGVTNLQAEVWYAFFLPRGTPAEIVGKLHAATVATMETPPVQDRVKEIGATLVAPERRSSEYLRKFVASEIEKWAEVVSAANIKAD